jgi:glycosyltransferase involved in cell wall biosynthesis
MKIAHVIRSLDPLGGGPPLIVVRLAAESARQGHEVSVFAHPAPDAQKRIDDMIGSLPGADRVRYETVSAPSGFKNFFPIDTQRSFENLFDGIDIVHLQGVWDPILKAAAAAARKRRIPYVVAPQGMLDPWSLSQKRWKKKFALLAGYQAMLNRSAFLQLLNRDEKELIAPLGLSCASEIIANGIAAEEFAQLPPADTFRAAHPEIGSAPYILFLSRLHYKKGLDILAAAFAQLSRSNSEIHLVVAGKDEGAEPGFRSDIQAAGLTERVHLVGPIFGKEKLAALVDAACFCLPSRQEGFSVAILEAMACGLPVVITKPCHFPEVAEENAGEVVELDAGQIAAALQRVLSNPTTMGATGRQMIFEKFTWEKVVIALIKAYQKHLLPV